MIVGAEPLSPAQYEIYMRSAQWKARKILYYQRHKRICGGCGATSDIDLHHHTYARLGCERDADLVPVCTMCHRLIHRHHKVSGLDLTTATFAVLRLVAEYGQDGLLQRLKALPVPDLNRGHIPRHLRTAKADAKGRLRNQADWKGECHPWWTRPPHDDHKPEQSARKKSRSSRGKNPRQRQQYLRLVEALERTNQALANTSA